MAAKGTTARALETLRRNARIVELKLAGLTWDEIGGDDKVKLSPRNCRDVWREFCSMEKDELVQADAMDVVFEYLEGLRQDRVEVSRVIEKTSDQAGMAAVRVGAIKTRADLRRQEIDLRQETGLLPRNLGRLKVELDKRFVVEQVIAHYRMIGATKKQVDELVAVLRGERPALAVGSN